MSDWWTFFKDWRSYRAGGRFENSMGLESSNVVGIICPPVGMVLSDLPKFWEGGGRQLPPLPLQFLRPCLVYSISRFFMKWREMSLEWNFSIFHELNFTENLFFAKTFSSLVRFYGHIIRHYFVTDVFPRFMKKLDMTIFLCV